MLESFQRFPANVSLVESKILRDPSSRLRGFHATDCAAPADDAPRRHAPQSPGNLPESGAAAAGRIGGAQLAG